MMHRGRTSSIQPMAAWLLSGGAGGRVCVAIVLFSLSACFSSDIAPVPESESTRASLSVESAPAQPKPNPFTLDIIDEARDGESLSVVLKVSSLDRFDGSRGLLVFSTYSGFDLKEQRGFSLCQVFSVESSPHGCTISAGQSVQFLLRSKSESITNYNIELLWGSEARDHPLYREIVASSKPAPEQKSNLGELKLTDLRVELIRSQECGQPKDSENSRCQLRYKVSGYMLYNASGGFLPIVQEATLGVGFIQRGSTNYQPESEEKVSFSQLNLSSGKLKPFSILLDRPLTQDQANRFIPTVRVAEFR